MPGVEKAKERVVPIWAKAVAGGIAGPCEAVALMPVDVIKTRVQLGRLQGEAGANMISAARHLGKQGWQAFYKGVTPFSVHLAAKYSTRFGSNIVFRGAIAGLHEGPATKADVFVSGMMSGFLEAMVIVAPFENVKTLLQKQDGVKAGEKKYNGTLAAARGIYRTQGVTGFWKGLTACMARNGTNQAFNFLVYDTIKYSVWGVKPGEHLETWKAGLSGGIATSIGPLVNNPFDMAKTRLMAQEEAKASQRRYHGLIHCVRTVAKEEGIGALYAGLLPRWMRLGGGGAITYMVIEKVLDQLEYRAWI